MFHLLFGKLSGEMKNLKTEVIHLKDDTDRKAWHQHVIASERDTEKHWRKNIITHSNTNKPRDYMRQYVKNSELSVIEVLLCDFH